MSEYYTDTAKLVQGSIDGTNTPRVTGRDVCGQVLLCRGVYTVPATAATGDVIKIARLPRGAVVIPHLCKVTCEALGATFTVRVGLEGEGKDALLSPSMALGAAGSKDFTDSVTDVVADDSTWVIATASTVTTPTVGKMAKFTIAYVTL